MNIQWKLIKTPDGWQGMIVIPTNPNLPPGVAGVGVHGKGKTPAQALGRAGLAAQKVEQLMADHPELAAILPPGAPLALKAITGLAKAASAGRLKEAMSHVKGPAIKRLGKALGL